MEEHYEDLRLNYFQIFNEHNKEARKEFFTQELTLNLWHGFLKNEKSSIGKTVVSYDNCQTA